MDDPIPAAALRTAATHLEEILSLAIEYRPGERAVVVWDARSPLSRTLAEAYRCCLPEAVFLEFERTEPARIRAAFEELAPGDLVVLVQSTSFRLDAFRIRLELFKRRLKVIEHPHLARMLGEEVLIYIDALAYDREYYLGVGHALKARLDDARVGVIDSGGSRLVYPAAFEPAKLNIGDYRSLPNVGGQYPIGEVFTESRDLEAVAGRVCISHFGDTQFTVNRPARPITLTVERGRVVGAEDATPEFEQVLTNIREDDGEVWLRELGFGMNRALTPARVVRDIGTFERMCGVHFSLGSKHATYNKPNIRKRHARHHVDVFARTEAVLLDDDVIYRDGAWVLPPAAVPQA